MEERPVSPLKPGALLWEIFDRAGLNSATFTTGKKSMTRIVLEVRRDLHNELLPYMDAANNNVNKDNPDGRQPKE